MAVRTGDDGRLFSSDSRCDLLILMFITGAARDALNLRGVQGGAERMLGGAIPSDDVCIVRGNYTIDD